MKTTLYLWLLNVLSRSIWFLKFRKHQYVSNKWVSAAVGFYISCFSGSSHHNPMRWSFAKPQIYPTMVTTKGSLMIIYHITVLGKHTCIRLYSCAYIVLDLKDIGYHVQTIYQSIFISLRSGFKYRFRVVVISQCQYILFAYVHTKLYRVKNYG